MHFRLPRLPTPGVPRVEPPRSESAVPVGGDRRIGIAEFGDREGRLVLWHHGTPGARRQITMSGRRAATELGIRLVCMERPGTGMSTNHRYPCVAAAADDVAAVADHLGHERFAIAGLSGGGPYTLAAAARFPDRVVAAGVLGGVCPVVGPEAVTGGPVELAKRLDPLLQLIRTPFGLALRLGLVPVVPAAHLFYHRVSGLLPEGDTLVLTDPEYEGMFVDDLVEALRTGITAVTHDVALFGADWGLRVSDISVPVRWWHGDADNIVPLDHAVATCRRIPDCALFVRPGESHLGGFAAADDVLKTLVAFFEDRPVVPLEPEPLGQSADA